MRSMIYECLCMKLVCAWFVCCGLKSFTFYRINDSKHSKIAFEYKILYFSYISLSIMASHKQKACLFHRYKFSSKECVQVYSWSLSTDVLFWSKNSTQLNSTQLSSAQWICECNACVRMDAKSKSAFIVMMVQNTICLCYFKLRQMFILNFALSHVMMLISLVSQYSGGLLRFHANHNSPVVLLFLVYLQLRMGKLTRERETFFGLAVFSARIWNVLFGLYGKAYNTENL